VTTAVACIVSTVVAPAAASASVTTTVTPAIAHEVTVIVSAIFAVTAGCYDSYYSDCYRVSFCKINQYSTGPFVSYSRKKQLYERTNL
jgi:hypothetical protein